MMCLFFSLLLFICGEKKTLWLWEFEVLVTFLEANEFISLADLLLIQSNTLHFFAQKRVCLVSHDCCLQSLKRIAIWCICVCVTVVSPIFHWEKEFQMENFICISVKISCFLCWVFYIRWMMKIRAVPQVVGELANSELTASTLHSLAGDCNFWSPLLYWLSASAVIVWSLQLTVSNDLNVALLRCVRPQRLQSQLLHTYYYLNYSWGVMCT